ncbi:tetratricopeptide repeat-containing sensor histidine kinase [Dyadobacter luticola]|nr:tetratricopeptide repeat-containing sensor histidine kinase [Dyadobacter luticola]
MAWAETIQDDNSALRIFGQILSLSEAAEWERGQMVANCRIGYYYGRKGQYYRACEYLYAGLYLAEKLNDRPFLAYSLRFLGDYHLNLHEYKKALLYYRKASPIFLKIGDMSRYIVSQNNIGLVYYEQKQYDKAIEQFIFCLKENRKLQDKNIDSYCFVNLAASYRQKRMYVESLNSIEGFRKLHATNINNQAFANAQTARTYLEMNKPKLALRFAKEAYSKRDSVLGNTQKEVSEILYLIYKRLGLERQALYYYEELTAIQSRNDLDMKKKQIDALRFTYENEKQRMNIITLNKNIEQKNRSIEQRKFERNILVVSLLFFVCLGGTIVYNNRLLKRKNIEIEEQKKQLGLIKEQLSISNLQLTDINNTLEERVRLRTEELTVANEELIRKNREIQLAFYNGQSLERKRVASELHDGLGSTLTGLKWQLEALDLENFSIQERLIYERVLFKMEDAYSEVRLISHNLLPAELETHGLSTALRKLVNDLNRNNRMLFRYFSNYTDGFFDKKGEMELYSICLELVNNIMKHSQATEAGIRLDQSTKEMILTVSDNGIGFPEKFVNESNGMGLRNIRNRTRSLAGRLEVKPAHPNGTLIYVKIQLYPTGEPSQTDL